MSQPVMNDVIKLSRLLRREKSDAEAGGKHTVPDAITAVDARARQSAPTGRRQPAAVHPDAPYRLHGRQADPTASRSRHSTPRTANSLHSHQTAVIFDT